MKAIAYLQVLQGLAATPRSRRVSQDLRVTPGRPRSDISRGRGGRQAPTRRPGRFISGNRVMPAFHFTFAGEITESTASCGSAPRFPRAPPRCRHPVMTQTRGCDGEARKAVRRELPPTVARAQSREPNLHASGATLDDVERLPDQPGEADHADESGDDHNGYPRHPRP
jgi:hypothetical protein